MQPIGGPPAVSPPEIFFTARPKHFIVSASFGSFDIKEMDHECVFRTKPATCSGVPRAPGGRIKNRVLRVIVPQHRVESKIQIKFV